jgi:hypothetical protein
LPKPVGIVAVTDAQARHLLHACMFAGIDVLASGQHRALCHPHLEQTRYVMGLHACHGAKHGQSLIMCATQAYRVDSTSTVTEYGAKL